MTINPGIALLFICLWITSLLVIGVPPAQASVEFHTVALKGQAAPGTEAGVIYRSIRSPAINNNGDVTFLAALTGPGINSNNDAGVWLYSETQSQLVARTGAQAPGTPAGIVFGSLNDPAISDSGHIGLLGNVAGAGIDDTNDRSLWTGSPGSINLVARRGDPAPGAGPGFTFGPVINYVLNESGQTAFAAIRYGPGLNTSGEMAVWSDTTAQVVPFARRGDPIPGEPDTVFILLSSPLLNSSGQKLFQAFLAPDEPATSPIEKDISLWISDNGSLNLVARTGQQAPGFQPGTTLGGVTPYRYNFNHAGQVAFTHGYVLPGEEVSAGQGLWAGTPRALSLVARDGFQAPGLDPGISFLNFEETPLLNAPGQVAFLANLTGAGVNSSNRNSLWSWAGDSLVLIAREGDQAFQDDPNYVFESIHSPVLSGNGQIAFIAELSRPGVRDEPIGIWATDLAGNLFNVVNEGDLFDVNDDPDVQEFRTVTGVGMRANSGGESGIPTSFNASGQLVFRLIFDDDSSGIFKASFSLPGDLDGDGFVGINDLVLIVSNWNQTIPPGNPLADPSGDGFVGIDDLNEVLGNWNAGTPPNSQANIPEPASAGFFLILTAGWFIPCRSMYR